MSQFGLGRGLEALIPRTPPPPIVSAVVAQSGAGTPLMIPVISIIINDYQPRQDFADTELEELAASIKEYGIIQPLVVTRHGTGYRLIAGERRLRASKLVGLAEVPAIIRDADEHQRALLAIIENIQRVDLNPIETALAYQRLADDFNLSQEEISVKMGKSRPAVANAMRLLKLHPQVQEALRAGMINEGHGKIMAGFSDAAQQLEMLQQITEGKLSVHDTAQRARTAVGKKAPRVNQRQGKDPSLTSKEELLRNHLGTKVSIDRRNGTSGTITIDFYSDEELRGILNTIIG